MYKDLKYLQGIEIICVASELNVGARDTHGLFHIWRRSSLACDLLTLSPPEFPP